MSEEFWVDEGGTVSGPISRDTLEARICAGAIQPSTWIGKDNKNFVPAGELYEAEVFGAPPGKSDITDSPKSLPTKPEPRKLAPSVAVPSPETPDESLLEIALTLPFLATASMVVMAMFMPLLILPYFIVPLIALTVLGTSLLLCQYVRNNGNNLAALSGGKWFALGTLLWAIGFPVFFYMRSQRSKTHRAHLILAIVGVGAVLISFLFLHFQVARVHERIEHMSKSRS